LTDLRLPWYSFHGESDPSDFAAASRAAIFLPARTVTLDG
jgi:hypothetical protein